MARDIAAHEVLDRGQTLLAVNASALISLDTVTIDNPLRVKDNRRDVEVF